MPCCPVDRRHGDLLCSIVCRYDALTISCCPKSSHLSAIQPEWILSCCARVKITYGTSAAHAVATWPLCMLCCCRYARQVEITNGRWAMLGFLAAITIEAATGKGILSQCIFYAKASGILGQQSGF